MAANPLLDAIIAKGAAAGVLLADEMRRRILRLTRFRLPHPELLLRIRRELFRWEPLLARTMSDTMLAAWLGGARKAAEPVPLPSHVAEAAGEQIPTPPPPAPPQLPPRISAEQPEPVIHFPIIESAAESLRQKRVLTKADFDLLTADAKRSAFTVARVGSLDALERIKLALAEDVAEGGTLREFRARVEQAVGAGVLAPAAVENVYRTNVAGAYTRGLVEVLGHPMVNDAFPYLLYSATHDSRVRPEHLAMETLGLDKTAVYRRDDKIWDKFLVPWSWG